MLLFPAYGRKQKTPEDTLKDWEDGKTFKIQGGPYCSIRDIEYMKKKFDSIEILCEYGKVLTIWKEINSRIIPTTYI